MQRKVEGSPNVETMLVAVRELRKEREKVKELQTQKTEQRTAIGKISLVKYIPSSNCKNCTVADNNQNSFSFLSSCRSKDCAIGAAVKRFKICSRWCDPRRFASGKQ